MVMTSLENSTFSWSKPVLKPTKATPAKSDKPLSKLTTRAPTKFDKDRTHQNQHLAATGEVSSINSSSSSTSSAHVDRCTNEQRKTKLKVACQRNKNKVQNTFNPNVAGHYSHIMVDDIHKVLYCYVPKAGCTSWKHLIALKSGKVSQKTLEKDWNIVHTGRAASMGLRRLSGNSIGEIHRKVKEYTKFMVMRNPLSRIYSAYRDKFMTYYDTYAKVYYSGILRRLYPNLQRYNGRMFLPFDKFIEMIVRAHKKKEGFLHLGVIDEHWRRVTTMCYPCQIDYDYLLKVETLDEDQPPVLKLFNATDLPHAHGILEDRSAHIVKQPFPQKEEPYSEAFGKLPDHLVQELLDVFSLDFDVFGYKQVVSERPECGYSGENPCC